MSIARRAGGAIARRTSSLSAWRSQFRLRRKMLRRPWLARAPAARRQGTVYARGDPLASRATMGGLRRGRPAADRRAVDAEPAGVELARRGRLTAIRHPDAPRIRLAGAGVLVLAARITGRSRTPIRCLRSAGRIGRRARPGAAGGDQENEHAKRTHEHGVAHRGAGRWHEQCCRVRPRRAGSMPW